MRFTLNLLAIIPAVIASALIPTIEEHAEDDAPKSGVLELELTKDQPKALFRVPCTGCLGEDAKSSDDEAFLFDFQAFPTEEPCGVSNISVNGITLTQTWNGTRGSGQGSLQSIPIGSLLPQHDLDLSWESSCLFENASDTEPERLRDNTAQVITVTIRGVDGKPIDSTSGFTISFKPVVPLELLRLSVVPDDQASQSRFSETWRNPPTNLRLSAIEPDVLVDGIYDDAETDNPSLQQEIKELKLLKAKQAELALLIEEKERLIKDLMRSDVKGFKDELHNCDNLSCVFKTILKGAKGAIKVVYWKLKPEHLHNSFHRGHGHFEHIEKGGQLFAEAQGSAGEAAPPAPQPTPPRHAEPPPDGGPRGHGRHGPPPPPQAMFFIALEIFLTVTGLGAIFALVTRCICSPRRRQEREASREERRNARAYRRAARRLRWRRWFYGLDEERIADYEEKRALICEQEDILESAMQDEIRMLREAHNVVHSIVQAEEGRGFRPAAVSGMGGMPCMCGHAGMNRHPCPHAHSSRAMPMHMPIPRPLSRTNSLPEYRSDEGSMSEPPAYEEEEDNSDVVVDGFREYSPSGSTIGDRTHVIGGNAENWTPESSVIATSPRPSMETMETRRYDEIYERASRSRSDSCSSSQFGGSEKSAS